MKDAIEALAERLARGLWLGGCCTPGLADRLVGVKLQDARHSEGCPLQAYLEYKAEREGR